MPGCGGKHEAKGFCMTHYSRLLRGEEVDRPVRRVGHRVECSVEGCENRGVTKGLCKTHDARRRRGADLDAPVIKPQLSKHCTYEDCGRVAVGFGLCSGHREQQRRAGAPYAQIATGRTKYKITICAIAGCANPHYAYALCARHHSRAMKYSLTAVSLQALLLIDECESCYEHITERSMAFDHDHSCCPGPKSCGNCLVGVLCLRCNAGIGYFENHRGKMMAAVDYLERTRSAL